MCWPLKSRASASISEDSRKPSWSTVQTDAGAVGIRAAADVGATVGKLFSDCCFIPLACTEIKRATGLSWRDQICLPKNIDPAAKPTYVKNRQYRFNEIDAAPVGETQCSILGASAGLAGKRGKKKKKHEGTAILRSFSKVYFRCA